MSEETIMFTSLMKLVKNITNTIGTNVKSIDNISKAGTNMTEELVMRSDYRLEELEANKDTIKAVEKIKFEAELSVEIQEIVTEAKGLSLAEAMKLLQD